jgi:hypothetical protein
MTSRHAAWLIPIAGLLAATPAFAGQYLSLDQARAALFPRATFTEVPVTLTPAQIAEIEKRSGQRVLNPKLKAWRTSTGGWFIVDQVIGKHEFITFALAVDAAGAVRGVEILDYRESYGAEVGAAAWRAQFTGKRADAPLRLGADIKNISGATLSSKHITDGVKRLLVTHALALAPLA